MGHYISGIVGCVNELREFSFSHSLHSPAMLVGELGFLPLSDEHLDRIFPDQGAFDNEMTYLSDELNGALRDLSWGGAVAYIETEYHGGQGDQGAVVFDHGECIYGPRRDSIGPINEALGFLGIHGKSDVIDAFEVADLSRHRSNEKWIENR